MCKLLIYILFVYTAIIPTTPICAQDVSSARRSCEHLLDEESKQNILSWIRAAVTDEITLGHKNSVKNFTTDLNYYYYTHGLRILVEPVDCVDEDRYQTLVIHPLDNLGFVVRVVTISMKDKIAWFHDGYYEWAVGNNRGFPSPPTQPWKNVLLVDFNVEPSDTRSLESIGKAFTVWWRTDYKYYPNGHQTSLEVAKELITQTIVRNNKRHWLINGDNPPINDVYLKFSGVNQHKHKRGAVR